MTFTWIPFYKELAQKLLDFRDDRNPLIEWIYSTIDGNLIKHLKDAPDGRKVPDVDPFTVFAIFNRGISDDKRTTICKLFKDYLKISEMIPQDYEGIPIMNSQTSNFIGFEDKRKKGDIEKLWRVFEDAVHDKDIEESYNALNGQYLIKFNITIGLFWIRPDKFLPLDGNCRDLLTSLGIAKFNYKFLPYSEYASVMKRLDAKMESESLGFTNYAEFSKAAYINKNVIDFYVVKTYIKARLKNDPRFRVNNKEGKNYLWIGTTDDMIGHYECHYEIVSESDKKANHVKERVFVELHCEGQSAKQFEYLTTINGIKPFPWKNYGVRINETGWIIKDYNLNELVDILIEELKRLDAIISEALKKNKDVHKQVHNKQYWWLVANPKIWSVSSLEVGAEKSYSLFNDEGHQRRIFQNFLNAKEGDIVLGYESTPKKQLVSLLTVSKASDGEEIYFKKTEEFPEPIDFSVLKSILELSNMEYMKNQQGSFFKVTSDEYDIIMDLIRGENPKAKSEKKEKYTKTDFLKEVFVDEKDYDNLENLLRRKKNLILQGAPGVGKTFAAKRLAYAMMGEKDESRVMQVQFHQNYSYEDFVMGYKPIEGGGFKLTKGVFYRFCRHAAVDNNHDYFFIIDEINRGNLSKIFGELLMLVEKDYRDNPIIMAYNDEPFSIPQNLYIIGMMNTADRSLAMIDYALRRRFSFFEMKPGFGNPNFKAEINKHKDTRLNKLVEAIKELNKTIENDPSLGLGFSIGHSYLCNLDKTYNLENIVEYDIVPMLREYWFDNNELFYQEAQKLRNALNK